jgi:hypothetical protein
VEGFALEIFYSGDIWQSWRRKKTQTANEEFCLILVSSFVREDPDFVAILPLRGLYASTKLDVLLEVMFLCDMLDIFECLWLWREFFFPMPFIQEIFVPRVSVRERFRIESSTGIAVPELGDNKY